MVGMSGETAMLWMRWVFTHRLRGGDLVHIAKIARVLKLPED